MTENQRFKCMGYVKLILKLFCSTCIEGNFQGSGSRSTFTIKVLRLVWAPNMFIYLTIVSRIPRMRYGVFPSHGSCGTYILFTTFYAEVEILGKLLTISLLNCGWNRLVCGKRMDIGRVVGGTTAKKFEFPWLGTITFKFPSRERINACGATLISDSYALSAVTSSKITKF